MKVSELKRTSRTQTKYADHKLREFIFENPGLTILYYLKEEHYIGICSCRNYWRRLHQHRKAGNHTLDATVVSFYKRRVDAHFVETLFHVNGYNGFRNLIKKI